MLRTVATQTQLESVNFELSQLSDNLSAHANTDLSDAHGFNLIFGPTDDGHGNNISVYRNAAGNLVGSFQISLVINGVRVYVPAQVTALAGKDPTTGQNTAAAIASQAGAGFSTWVTQFNDTLTGLVRTILESYLMPHTVQGYWEAHGGMALITPELDHFGVAGSGSAAGWWSSGAALVARSSVSLNADGWILRLPCELRLGGPPQTVQISPFSPNSHYTEIGTWSNFGESGFPYNFVIQPTVVSGSLPLTYAYKYLDNNNLWQDITPNVDFAVPFYVFNVGNGEALGGAPGTMVHYSSTTGQLTFIFGQPHAKGSYTGCIVRVIVTGQDGIPVSTATDGNFPQFSWLVFHQPQ